MNNQPSVSKKALSPLLLVSAIVALLCVTTGAEANLAPLSNDELAQIDGRCNIAGVSSNCTGALLGFQLSINQKNPNFTNNTSGGITCDTAAKLPFCRLGLQFNNVSDWLLFKGFTGLINIPQILIYGSNLADVGAGGQFAGSTAVNSSAIALSIAFPNTTNGTTIAIRNFGFTLGLAIPTAGGNNFAATTAAGNQAAYFSGGAANFYQNTTSTAANYSTSQFDLTGGPGGGPRETGLLGFTANGNLNVGGTLYVFAK